VNKHDLADLYGSETSIFYLVTDILSVHGESFGTSPQDKSVQDESVT